MIPDHDFTESNQLGNRPRSMVLPPKRGYICRICGCLQDECEARRANPTLIEEETKRHWWQHKGA